MKKSILVLLIIGMMIGGADVAKAMRVGAGLKIVNGGINGEAVLKITDNFAVNVFGGYSSVDVNLSIPGYSVNWNNFTFQLIETPAKLNITSVPVGAGIIFYFVPSEEGKIVPFISADYSYVFTTLSASYDNIPVSAQYIPTMNGWGITGKVGAEYMMSKSFSVFGAVGTGFGTYSFKLPNLGSYFPNSGDIIQYGFLNWETGLRLYF